MSDEPIQEILIRRCCDEVKHLHGDAVEIGVHRGDSALTICDSLKDSTVYLFDTFEGMPAEMITKGLDYHRPKDFDDTNVALIKKKLADYSNAIIVPGIFPKTATIAPHIRFAHIDVDLYLSTKAALEWCWPLMVDGGVILNDDYGCSSCAGAKKAVDDFAAEHADATVEVEHRRAIIRRRLDDAC